MHFCRFISNRMLSIGLKCWSELYVKEVIRISRCCFSSSELPKHVDEENVKPRSLSTQNESKHRSKSVHLSKKGTKERTPFSFLYVPTSLRSTVPCVLEPYMNFEKVLDDAESLTENYRRRNISFESEKIRQWKDEWLRFDALKEESREISFKQRGIQLKIKAHKEENRGLQNKALLPEEIVKEKKLSDAEHKKNVAARAYFEENIVMDLLNIPNQISPSTPDDADVVLRSEFDVPEFPSERKTHMELKSDRGFIESSTVSPGAIYFHKELAEVELALEDYLLDIFDQNKFIFHSNPDFAKSFVVEGCGFDVKSESISISAEKVGLFQHIVGGSSLASFVPFFAKRIVMKSSQYLPQKIFATGRIYSPFDAQNCPGSVFGSMQSSVASAFIVSPFGEDFSRELFSLISEAFSGFGLHFRLVQVCAQNLRKFESSAVSVQMLTVTQKDGTSCGELRYVEVARISQTGNYISKRLLMMYALEDPNTTDISSPSTDFLQIVYGEVLNISKFIALMVENTQDSSGNYKIPEVLQKYMLS